MDSKNAIFKNLASAISRIDEKAGLDETDRRRLVILQYCNCLAIFSMMLFIVLYLLADPTILLLPILLSGICIPLYLLSMWLNRKGLALPAKLLFFSVFTASAFLSTAFLLGRAPGVHFYFLLAAVVPLFIWSIKKPFWILLFMAANLASFCYIQYRVDESNLLIKEFPGQWLVFFNALSVVAVYLITVLILVLFQQRAEEDAKTLNAKARIMEDLMRKFEELSNTDTLTNLHNRRAMLIWMEEERIRMNRNHTAFAVIICDIDFFKDINDKYGHEAGDAFLIAIGGRLKTSLRDVDRLARWGGEEFLILLPDTFIEGALTVAEKLRQGIETLRVPWNGKNLQATMTFGVAMHDITHTDLDKTIRNADAALYRGKNSGRNRVNY